MIGLTGVTTSQETNQVMKIVSLGGMIRNGMMLLATVSSTSFA